MYGDLSTGKLRYRKRRTRDWRDVSCYSVYVDGCGPIGRVTQSIGSVGSSWSAHVGGRLHGVAYTTRTEAAESLRHRAVVEAAS